MFLSSILNFFACTCLQVYNVYIGVCVYNFKEAISGYFEKNSKTGLKLNKHLIHNRQIFVPSESDELLFF